MIIRVDVDVSLRSFFFNVYSWVELYVQFLYLHNLDVH